MHVDTSLRGHESVQADTWLLSDAVRSRVVYLLAHQEASLRTSVLLAFASTIAVLSTAAVAERSTQGTDLDAAPRLRLVEELRIGSATDPNIGFGAVGQIAIDREGQIYVFETQERSIRVYGATGQFIRRIGRQGDGPGEFRGGISLGIKGDTVWAGELSGLELESSIFNRRTGSLISAARVQPSRVPGRGSSQLLLLPAFLRSDGTLVSAGYLSYNARGAAPTGITINDTLRVPRLLFNITGAVTDTLVWHGEPPRPASPATAVTIEGQRRTAPRPFADFELSLLFGDGRFVVQRPLAQSATQGTARVTRQGLSGNDLYSRAFTYRPVRYSPATLDSLAARSLRSAAMIIVNGAVQQPRPVEVTPASLATMRAAMSFPTFQPPIQTGIAGADGSLWLEREYDVGPTDSWILLNPQGNLRGVVEVSPRMRIAWSSGDTVWAILPDADDVPWVVKYRITNE